MNATYYKIFKPCAVKSFVYLWQFHLRVFRQSNQSMVDKTRQSTCLLYRGYFVREYV